MDCLQTWFQFFLQCCSLSSNFQEARIGEASSSTSPHTAESESLQPCGSWISNSLFKLYEPAPPQINSIDIIFFHGLQFEHNSDAYLWTWRSGDVFQEVWPQTWLPAKYPEARIISVSYDAAIRTSSTEGRMDMHIIGENLLPEVLRLRKKQGEECPVILVGHSFGGLIVKQLCVHAYRNKHTSGNGQDICKFLESIRGIFFYATPHRGINPAVMWKDAMLSSMPPNKPLLSFLELLGKDAARLHEEFEQRCREYKWLLYGVGELHPMEGQSNLFVEEASSRFGDIYRTVESDHFSTCRPASNTCSRYLHLVDLIDVIYDQKNKVLTAQLLFMAWVFVKNHIIDELRKFCALPEGCPGVLLTLGILRTQCVRELTPLAHRGDKQAISLETLRTKWLDYVSRQGTIHDEMSRRTWMESLLNYEHWWPAIPEVCMDGEFERARNLLWEDDLEVVKAKLEKYWNQHLQDWRPSPRAREDEVIRISDELYEVYAPMSPPQVELVFVHGLQEDICDRQSYLTAWSTRKVRNICWLNTLLPRHLKKPPRIISVSCDASRLKTATKGRLDMYLTAENLVSSLIRIGKVGQRCPVVLVGHSLGGLVITEVCNEAQKRDGSYTLEKENVYRSFLGNVKGLFYYSTPFKGSLSEVFVQESASAFRGAEKGDLMESLQVLDQNLARRNYEFARLKKKYGWSTSAVVESNVTSVEDLPAISSRPLVDEASARADIVDEICMIRNTDHFTICRPETEKSDNFLLLVDFVHDLLYPNVHKST